MRKKPLKIIPFNQFEKIKSKITNKKTVLVGGCFDILHWGHVTFLKRAKASGDILMVALESDEFIWTKKRKQPIHSQYQRAQILAALELVDMVVLLPYFTSDIEYSEMVRKIRPDIIAVTQGDMLIEIKRRQAKEVGARLKVVASLLKGFSSKKIYETFFSD